MSFNQYKIFLSCARLSKYRIACHGQEEKAMELYRANIKLSQELYAVLGQFEVVLRNQIDRHFSRLKGECWLEDGVSPGTAWHQY